MNLHSYCSGPVHTNTYLLTNPATGKAVLFDAPMDSAVWVMQTLHATGTSLTHILLTHSHWDHTADAEEIRAKTGAALIVHPDDEYRLHNPNEYIGFPLNITFAASPPDGNVHHGETRVVAGVAFEIRHTPGHTEGGVCFIAHDHKVVITGDTLFEGSIGRTDMHGGNIEQLIQSINTQLLTLPDGYLCLPGHGNPTTIGDERRDNPFLQ